MLPDSTHAQKLTHTVVGMLCSKMSVNAVVASYDALTSFVIPSTVSAVVSHDGISYGDRAATVKSGNALLFSCARDVQQLQNTALAILILHLSSKPVEAAS